MTKFTKSQTELIAAVIRNQKGMTKESKMEMARQFAAEIKNTGTRFKFREDVFKYHCLHIPHNPRFIGSVDVSKAKIKTRFTNMPESWLPKTQQSNPGV